ncbi:hypothetical protein CGLO_12577 [Colletotrichum gloeosporioides Cg-14]|nr:hypothetical protein CGLO_12577 [Colletotrichum gloeosporioides Cg-14]
MRSKTST